MSGYIDEAALARQCPVCDAPVGQSCSSVFNRPVSLEFTHIMREGAPVSESKSDLSETTERITTPEELAELAVGTNVWDEDGRRYRVDLWRNQPGSERGGDERVLVGPGELVGVVVFMFCREWVSLTPVAPPEPTPEERIATRVDELVAGFLTPYHDASDAFDAVKEAARMIAELEAKLAAPPAPVDAVGELGAVARAHPSTFIDLNRESEFVLTCGGKDCDWTLTVPQDVRLDARAEHARHAGEQLHAAVLRAGYFPVDHIEYAADHKRAGLDVVDDDDELFTDRVAFMDEYSNHRNVTLLQRTVGPWETIEVRGEDWRPAANGEPA